MNYKAGDKVIRLDVENTFIYTVQRVESDVITIVRKKKQNATRVWGTWLTENEIRHATDAEIKAGKRL